MRPAALGFFKNKSSRNNNEDGEKRNQREKAGLATGTDSFELSRADRLERISNRIINLFSFIAAKASGIEPLAF